MLNEMGNPKKHRSHPDASGNDENLPGIDG
jgi:hypothetical protein